MLGNFCFGRAGIRGYGWADSVTQDRWLGAALACERAAAALVQAMALSPRPIAACVTMMQMCAHFQEPYWLRQLFLGNAPETITHEDIDEPGMMDAALAHLVELGVPRLTPEQTPDALPSGLAPRAEHEMDRQGLLAAARAGPAARAPGRADGVCAVPASALGRQL